MFIVVAFGAAITMNCINYYVEESSRSESERNTVPTDDNVDDLILQDEDEIDTNDQAFHDEQVAHHFRIKEAIPSSQKSPFRQAVAAVDLLIHDNKMKYLSFINITVS